MPILESLRTVFDGDTRSLEAAATRAVGAVEGFGSATRGIINRAGKATLALGTAGLVGGFVAMFGPIRAAADRTGKLATTLNTTAEQVETLRLAASRGGTDIETMRVALGRVSRAAGELAAGDTTAGAEALLRLGLSSEQVGELLSSPVQLLEELQFRISDIGDAALRAKTEADIFGRGFQALRPVLQADNLLAAEMDVRAFGTAMSETASRDIQRFNDRLGDLAALGKGALTQTLGALSGPLSEIATTLVETTRATIEAAGGMEAFGRELGGSLLEGARTALGVISTIGKAVGFLGDVTGAVGNVIGGVTAAGAALGRGELGGAGVALSAGIEDALARFQDDGEQISILEQIANNTAQAVARAG